MNKKKTVHAAKTTRRSVKHTATPKQTVLFRRIVIISACLVLVTVTAVLLNKQQVEQSVAGASIMNGLYMQATVTMPQISDASAYNIYYKEDKDKDFVNSVRNVPTTVPTYTISHLKKGVNYQYRFAALDSSGKEFIFSEILPLTNLQSM
jgi:hypothetical protein